MARGKGDPVLHPAGGQDSTSSPAADVVFIHGLGGDANGTWRASPDSWWPSWIAEDGKHLAVWSLDYDAEPSGWLGRAMPLTDRADNILTLFAADGLGKRPLFLICHSLGGLVAKQMLRSAEGRGVAAWQRIGNSVAGIVFLATPHTGSPLANYLGGLARIIGGRPTVALKDLEHNAAPLRDLNKWFRNYAHGRNLPILVSYENHDTKGVRVVDEASADPGLPGLELTPIDADHALIAKPSTREDALVYKRVLQFIAEQISSTDRHSPEMSATDGAQTALRVMYYWLDPITMSLLLSSRVESSLHKILGEAPIILPTAALADAKELVARFGSRADSNPTFLKDYLSIEIESEGRRDHLKSMDSTKLPKALVRGVNIYNGTDETFLPDIEAYQTIKDPNRWPNGYSIFYYPKGDPSTWDELQIVNSMCLWRFARREDLQNYTTKIRALVDAVNAQQLTTSSEVENYAESVSEIGSGDRNVQRETYFSHHWLNNKAVEAMLFAGRNYWPQDFLVIYGRQDCVDGWEPNFTIMPREPFLQIAVLENTSTQTPLSLTAIRLQEAHGDGLRLPDTIPHGAPSSQPFPPGILLPGEKLVIPLRIDFRRNRDEMRYMVDWYDPALSERMHAFVRGRSQPVSFQKYRGKAIFAKVPAAFTEPVEPKSQTAYTYGNELSLVSAVSGKMEIPLRPYDPRQIFMVAGYESGSCPFLYVRYSDHPDVLKIG